MTDKLIESKPSAKKLLNSDHAQESSSKLSGKETRAMVTPYAFSVSDDLLGVPLARPSRRGLAMLIDLVFVSVLSSVSILIFAFFVAVTFFKAGGDVAANGGKSYLRKSLRFVASLLLFVVAYAIADGFQQDDSAQQVVERELQDPRTAIDVFDALFKVSCNDDAACYLLEAENFGSEARRANSEVDLNDWLLALDEPLNEKNWSEQQKQDFIDAFTVGYDSPQFAENERDNKLITDTFEDNQSNQVQQSPALAKEPEVSGLLDKVEIFVEELSLGLGWAALYFSAFTAWSNGQTLGKKICGIEVVNLKGEHLTLWESFGRYGGYAAGLSTGLTGFLQIYWDPNRQAIHDKISETLVIRSNAKKLPFAIHSIKQH